MTPGDDLTRIATELYALPLADFVRVRSERAKSATDRGLAAAVAALRKPSIAAWVVNVFAQERSGELAEALQLARELREAQDDLDAPALARLGRERRALTRRLAEQARDLALARGEKVTAGTLDAVQQTIGAAFFDEEASIAVASGRLIRELEPSEPVVLDDLVAGDIAGVGSAEPVAPADELAERRRRRQAERALREANDAVAAAEREKSSADRAAGQARGLIDEVSARIADLEQEIVRARGDLDAARRSAAAADERASKASAGVEAAREAAEEAHGELDGWG